MNYRMTDIQAALISSQLDKLDMFSARRKSIVNKYNQAFADMPDDIDFPDTLTAEEIIRFLGGLKKESPIRQSDLLEKVGLQEAKKLKVGQFSKGMRQRLNLAQSLMGDSTLYILDEPTNGLDPYWIANLKRMLEEEQAEDGQDR